MRRTESLHGYLRLFLLSSFCLYNEAHFVLASSVKTTPRIAQAMPAADEATLKHALDLYDQGKLEESGSLLQVLAKRFPHHFEIVETLGLIYAERGDVAQAIPLLESAVVASPGSAVAQANLGAAYFKAGRAGDAVRTLQRSVRIDPSNAQTQLSLGSALMQTGKPELAAKAFESAAKNTSSPSPDAGLYHDWALALFMSGHLKEAANELAKVPGQENSVDVQSLSADIAERQGNFEQAVLHYKRTAELDPSEANINALGLEFLRHWTFDEAIKIYQYGVAKYPESTKLKLGLGIAEYSSNNYTVAAPIFSALLAKEPDNGQYADLLGHNCSLMPDDQNTGCAGLEQFAAKHPANARAATYAAASILHRPTDRDELGKARQLLEQAIAADPKLPEAYYQMGVLDQQQKQWADSVAPLERAVALRPAYAEAHYRLARAYFQTGKREEGQQHIALQQKYSQQAKDDLNARFKQVTTFLVSTP